MDTLHPAKAPNAKLITTETCKLTTKQGFQWQVKGVLDNWDHVRITQALRVTSMLQAYMTAKVGDCKKKRDHQQSSTTI